MASMIPQPAESTAAHIACAPRPRRARWKSMRIMGSGWEWNMKRTIGLVAAALVLFAGSAISSAQTLPSYMAPISGKTAATSADVATKDMLALNTGMFELYGDASKIFQKNILSKHHVILGLFSGAGGRLILYRPGMPPVEAPQVPIVYQLLKSVGPSPRG